jgi:large subunit ribosomal protein L2
MSVKKFRPTTPSRRQMVVQTSADLTSNKAPEKGLLAPTKRTAGRNARGRITIRHRGGGAKKNTE